MSTPQLKPLPFKGEIVDAARLAVLKRVKLTLPSESVERLKEATRKIRSLIKQQEALSFESVRAFHSASRESAVQSIVSDTSPTERQAHLDTLGREFAEKREALIQSQGRIFVSISGDVEKVGAAIVHDLSELAGLLEEEERVASNNYSVAFRPTPQLELIQSVAILAKRRFDGIGAVIDRTPTLHGTPASFFIDLLDEAANW